MKHAVFLRPQTKEPSYEGDTITSFNTELGTLAMLVTMATVAANQIKRSSFAQGGCG